MSDEAVLLTFGALVLGLLIVGAVYVLRAWNSPYGERYSRAGMQGPFVPLGEDGAAAGKQREES